MASEGTIVARRAGEARSEEVVARRRIAFWLIAVALLVSCMVVLGGFTRLSHSGLSMVEWRPVTGWLPPIGESAWQAAFEDYKRFPEYQKINRDMSLDAFKSIFYVEYFHRLLGRVIGLAYLLPFVVFLVQSATARRIWGRLFLLFVLGGLQGALGWFMVKSGLVDRPDVSHYRLTAHLAMALLIFGALLWVAWDLLRDRRARGRSRNLAGPAWLLLIFVVVQILLGGFVAGLDAGFIYTDFPLMGGALAPPDLLAQTPLWRNFVENPATVQFMHRLMAYMIAILAIYVGWRVWRDGVDPSLRRAAGLVVALVAAQIALGILTIVYVVPLALGVIHQAGALAVFAATLDLVHRTSSRAVYEGRGSL